MEKIENKEEILKALNIVVGQRIEDLRERQTEMYPNSLIDLITHQLCGKNVEDIEIHRLECLDKLKDILKIPDDYSHDLINGKSLKADIRSEIFSHYLDGRDKPPYELVKQKVNHIINEELYERFNRNPAFTPVPDVSITPPWTKDNPKSQSRAR